MVISAIIAFMNSTLLSVKSVLVCWKLFLMGNSIVWLPCYERSQIMQHPLSMKGSPTLKLLSLLLELWCMLLVLTPSCFFQTQTYLPHSPSFLRARGPNLILAGNVWEVGPFIIWPFLLIPKRSFHLPFSNAHPSLQTYIRWGGWGRYRVWTG